MVGVGGRPGRRGGGAVGLSVSVLKVQPQYRQVTVSRSDLAVRRWAGKQKDLGSNPLRLSFLFTSCVCGHCLVTLSSQL